MYRILHSVVLILVQNTSDIDRLLYRVGLTNILLLIFLNFGTSIKLLNMGGKHRKSRYDSSSLSATDTSDSSSSESSDSEVSFVVNHSHRHKSQHRINKFKHKKNKKHKKDRRYRSESYEYKHKKHKHHSSKHHKEQKHHTNSNPYRTNNKERHSDRNFDDWYYQDRIAYHSERDKFDERYHYRNQGSYDRLPKEDSYDRYCRNSHAIDRHYER